MGLNNIFSKSWDYISGVAKNISVQGLQDSWNTYMIQSPDELLKVTRDSMLRKNTVTSNLDMQQFENVFSKSSNKADANYVSSFSSLKQKINANKIDEAMEIASSINDRFGDKDYLDYLQQAVDNKNKFDAGINNAYQNNPNALRAQFIEDTKDKIRGNKIISNFADENTEEWLANKAYQLHGKKGYFTTDDKKTNLVRAGVVGGAYMGGSMVVRGLQGGNPITNEYGERDVAGIPFI